MAHIGTFTLKDGTWTGTIRTMTINIKAQLVPNKEKANGAPDFRLYAGGAELGAAWRQESKDGETPYLAVKLDDPSFAHPMRAAFFENENEGTGVLIWNRPKQQVNWIVDGCLALERGPIGSCNSLVALIDGAAHLTSRTGFEMAVWENCASALRYIKNHLPPSE